MLQNLNFFLLSGDAMNRAKSMHDNDVLQRTCSRISVSVQICTTSDRMSKKTRTFGIIRHNRSDNLHRWFLKFKFLWIYCLGHMLESGGGIEQTDWRGQKGNNHKKWLNEVHRG